MEINIPEVLEEVSVEFARYEAALTTNDVEVLDELFWYNSNTIRYGAAENLYGYDEIAAFRSGRNPAGLDRQLSGTVITTFGRDAATAMTLFEREGSDRIGRQSQTWIRRPGGWRIVAAHVSLIDA